VTTTRDGSTSRDHDRDDPEVAGPSRPDRRPVADGGRGRGVVPRLTAVAVAAWPSRSALRVGHLALAATLGLYVYSPLAAVPAVELAVQAVVFPALALSGMLLWQGGRLRARLRRRADAGEDRGGGDGD
jgi:hypothetical protein